MSLVERIRKIALQEGVEQDLILDEVACFVEDHWKHGGYKIELGYLGDRLESIHLECTAAGLVDVEVCDHQNPDMPYEYSCSIVYSRRPIREVELQARRRRGRH